MIYLVISVFLITAFIWLYLKKDIFYPAVCVNIIFALVLLGYEITSDIYAFQLNDATLIFLLCNVLTFTLSCLLTESVLDLNIRKVNNAIYSIPSKKVHNVGLLVISFSMIYICMRLSNYQFGTSLLSYMNLIRDADVEDTSRNFSAYMQPIILTTFALFIWSKKFTNTKVSKTFTLLVFIVFIFAIILNTGKQIVFMVIISYAFIVGVNRVKHYVYLITAVGVLFSLYMLFLRGLPGGMAYYLSMYLVSPIIAFQEFYFQQVSNSASSHVFWFFERLMGLLTGGVSMSLHKEFVWVGLPTNVYTAFSDYVYISAELSYLMMVIHGCISGVLWRLSRNYISVKIFYSYFIYTFSFIFYHESFMTNISSWIQITLCIIVFSQFLKAQKIK